MKLANAGIKTLPRHVAIIMDGNGTWAKKRGLPRNFGHRQGARALKTSCFSPARSALSI